MEDTMRTSCLQRLCLDGDGMFFGNSGVRVTTKVTLWHFIGCIFYRAYYGAHKGSIDGSISRGITILYNFSQGNEVCLTRICRSNVTASVNVSMKPVVVLPETFQQEDTMSARGERFGVQKCIGRMGKCKRMNIY